MAVQDISIVSLKIDGSWEPQDFIDVLHSVEAMYYTLLKIDQVELEWLMEPYFRGRRREIPTSISFSSDLELISGRIIDEARYSIEDEKRIKVTRIDYASPGQIDLSGLAKIIKVIFESVGNVKKYYDDKQFRDERKKIEIEREKLVLSERLIDIETKKANLQSILIQNAKNMIEVIEAHPRYTELLIPILTHNQNALSTRLADGKLNDSEYISYEESITRSNPDIFEM